MRSRVLCATSTSVWQHVSVSGQIRPETHKYVAGTLSKQALKLSVCSVAGLTSSTTDPVTHGGWQGGRMAGRVAGRVAGTVAGRVAGWLAGWLTG